MLRTGAVLQRQAHCQRFAYVSVLRTALCGVAPRSSILSDPRVLNELAGECLLTSWAGELELAASSVRFFKAAVLEIPLAIGFNCTHRAAGLQLCVWLQLLDLLAAAACKGWSILLSRKVFVSGRRVWVSSAASA